jgi:hypothetical protein
MQTNKQTADAGKDSVIYQANEGITVNEGLTLEQARTVSLDVFKANFYDLGEDVRQIATRRAEEITNEYLKKLQIEDERLIEKTVDPDIRYNLFEVQKAYARFGDKEMSNLLVDVLVQRTKEDVSFPRIVLNEALTVIPKLTKLQIDILTLLYLVETVGYINPTYQTISTFYEDLMAPCLDDRLLPDNEYFYLHLQSCGCVAIILGVKRDLAEVFHKKFKGKYPDLETINQEIRNTPKLDAFEKSWSGKSVFNRCTLSSVGVAIGLINFNSIRGSKFKMDTFIFEYLNE